MKNLKLKNVDFVDFQGHSFSSSKRKIISQRKKFFVAVERKMNEKQRTEFFWSIEKNVETESKRFEKWPNNDEPRKNVLFLHLVPEMGFETWCADYC